MIYEEAAIAVFEGRIKNQKKKTHSPDEVEDNDAFYTIEQEIEALLSDILVHEESHKGTKLTDYHPAKVGRDHMEAILKSMGVEMDQAAED